MYRITCRIIGRIVIYQDKKYYISDLSVLEDGNLTHNVYYSLFSIDDLSNEDELFVRGNEFTLTKNIYKHVESLRF